MSEPREIQGMKFICEVSSEVTNLRVVKDSLVVDCDNGVTHIISKDFIEEKERE